MQVEGEVSELVSLCLPGAINARHVDTEAPATSRNSLHDIHVNGGTHFYTMRSVGAIGELKC